MNQVKNAFISKLQFFLKSTGCLVGFSAVLMLNPLLDAKAGSFTFGSTYEYDSRGLIIKEIFEPNSPRDCVLKTYSYDSYGNRLAVSEGGCPSASTPRTTSSSFSAQSVVVGGVSYSSPEGVFATGIVNALGHAESREYHPRFGALTKLVGPNGTTTTWAYDGMGRKTEERLADGTYTRWEYKLCGAIQTDGSAAPCTTSATVGNHSLSWYELEASYGSDGALLVPKQFKIYDALDRVVRTQTQDFQGEVVVQDYSYNAKGLLDQQSNLYRLNGGAPAWSAIEYDAIGRVTRESLPDVDATATAGRAITSFSYNGLITSETNAEGQTKTTHRNAVGQIAKIVDHLGGEVTFSYDALGRTIQTNAAGAITQINYDLKGQKIWMDDPSMGSWGYAYNAFGELVYQQDGLGNVSSMTYDAGGRMISRNERDLIGNWYYDKKADGSGCGAGVGKLCEVRANNGYQRVQTYDSMGRPTGTSIKLDSSSTLANMSQSYDQATGRLTSKTWPTGYRASYEYTSGGYLRKVTGGGVPGHNQTVTFEVLAMNPQGDVTQYRQGNNITTLKTVDGSTGRLKSVQATLAGQNPVNVLNNTYTHDALGNLKTRSDVISGVNESFQYDSLNRLARYTALGGGLPGTQNIQTLYDSAGHLKYKSDVGFYNYDATRPSRLVSITSTSGAGWSALGAVSQANTGTRLLNYAYDDSFPGAKTVNGTALGKGDLWYTVTQDSSTGRNNVRWETYTSYGMPKEILFGNLVDSTQPVASTVAERTLTFVYGPEHQRVRQDVQLGSSAPAYMSAGSTWYYNEDDGQGLAYEKEVKVNGTIEHKHYINAGGITFANYVKREGALNGKPATSINYLHHDHLGSIAAVSNESGAVIETMAYDPWGKRRLPNGTNDRLDSLYGASTDRGYTMHEHLDELGLVHMNGRVYDPLIGRFITADPYVQEPYSLASHNRYSYVWNNPLKYTDPSGFNAEGFWAGTVYVFGNNFSSNSSWANAWSQAAATPWVSSAIQSANNSFTAVVNVGTVAAQAMAPTGEEISALSGVGSLALLEPTPFGELVFVGASASVGVRSLGRGYTAGKRALAARALAGQEAARGLASVPGRVGSRINLSNEGMDHVIARHLSGKANASQFSLAEAELRSVLSSSAAVGSPVVRSIESADGIRYIREFDAGRVIGTDRFNGNQATSVMTIMTDSFGNLVSTFPGLLK